jgi:hypothetical protein
MFPYLWSISQANIPLIFVVGLLMSGVLYSASNGVWPSFYGEMFDTRVRLSGMVIPTQIGFALAGFAPTIAAAVRGSGRTVGFQSRSSALGRVSSRRSRRRPRVRRTTCTCTTSANGKLSVRRASLQLLERAPDGHRT